MKTSVTTDSYTSSYFSSHDNYYHQNMSRSDYFSRSILYCIIEYKRLVIFVKEKTSSGRNIQDCMYCMYFR